MSSFRGGSADAVAALTEQLGGLARGATAELGGVAEDLFSIAGTLRSEGSLRRFATDNSVAPEARTGLVGELFSSKVSSQARDLLLSAVTQRWTRTRDLADAMEHLGVIAAVRSAGADGERLVDELFTVRSLVSDNSELRNALSDPARTIEAKSALLHSLLDGRALPATVLLARQSLSGSYRTVSVALEEYEKVAADVHGESVATVWIARPLADAETQRLTDALTRQYGRPVHLNVVVDPDVVGGIRVEIGDDVIDGTVSSRLADAQRLLAG
jgi:F-type H+-transporting ATPase subunit delta